MNNKQTFNAKKSVANTDPCYGCGACVAACPKKCISLKESAEGFYVPDVDAAKCVNCGLCVKACPARMSNPKASVDLDKVNVFGAWAKDENVLQKSSSGGLVMSVAKILSKKGYKFVGVKYAPENVRAEHFIAETLEEFKPAMGSKYIQSFTETAFKDLERNGKYLIVGTPCQVFALRPLFPNAFFIDFWCHGVPSAILWRSFVRAVKKGHDEKKLAAVWRDKKRFGWHNGWCMILKDGDETLYSSSVKERCFFFHHFLRCNAQNKTCYTCPFGAYNSAADIRVGDFWGEEYAANNKGVSKVALLTDAAREMEAELREVCVMEKIEEDVMHSTPYQFPYPPMREFFIRLLRFDFYVAHIIRRSYGVISQCRRLVDIIRKCGAR